MAEKSYVEQRELKSLSLLGRLFFDNVFIMGIKLFMFSLEKIW